MFQRLLNPVKTRSYFLFGARGVGKTTWLETQYHSRECIWIDLLDDAAETKYSRSPHLLAREIDQWLESGKKLKAVIIDEVQKVPKLLDIAQKYIQKKEIRFVLTGSSARKLKRGARNLLGGRANTYALFPLSRIELGESFDLDKALQWGTLPECWGLQTEREKSSYLRSYCTTYLKEEILVEQLIRKLPPFRDFLNLLAQCNGKLINFEKFSRDVGVDHKTIQAYLDILEETYLGIVLRPFHPSLRKSQLQQPKFYFFDTGVCRFLSGVLGTPLLESTSAYGEAFESWMIHEILRANTTFEKDERLSFYRSKHGAEIDLILSKGRNWTFIEVKSGKRIDEKEVQAFSQKVRDFKQGAKLIWISQDPARIRVDNVECFHYEDFLKTWVGR